MTLAFIVVCWYALGMTAHSSMMIYREMLQKKFNNIKINANDYIRAMFFGILLGPLAFIFLICLIYNMEKDD